MVLLGFADDILDVRWRYKVWFPAIAGIPLLVIYYTSFGVTYIVVPLQLRFWLGDIVQLGKKKRKKKKNASTHANCARA